MTRFLLLTCLFFAGLAAPAIAGPRVQTSGDPRIDAQWAQQLSRPVVPRTEPSRGIFRMIAPRQVAPQRQRRVVQPRVVEPRARRSSGTTRAAQVRRAPAPKPRVMDPAFLPTVIDYQTDEKPGTIVIDPSQRYLYLVQDDGKARRYGVGVGRDGFGWHGSVRIGRKAEWPTWTPPAEMRKRQPYLPVSMPGGPSNPLGARALYLHKDGNDTLYRIHGSNEPWTIGHAVSSGCFRMRNEDVTELYGLVGVGTKVVVR